MLSGSVEPKLFRWFGSGVVTGALLSASVLATSALVLGQMPDVIRKCALVLLVSTIVGVDFAEPGLLPQRNRMVRRSIVLEDARIGLLQFGFELGTGVQTLAPRGAAHVYVVAAVLLNSPAGAIVGGIGFAIGRIAMAAGSIKVGLNTFDRLIARFERLAGSVALVAAVLATAALALK
jgi:hypothetical protein